MHEKLDYDSFSNKNIAFDIKKDFTKMYLQKPNERTLNSESRHSCVSFSPIKVKRKSLIINDSNIFILNDSNSPQIRKTLKNELSKDLFVSKLNDSNSHPLINPSGNEFSSNLSKNISKSTKISGNINIDQDISSEDEDKIIKTSKDVKITKSNTVSKTVSKNLNERRSYSIDKK